MTQPISAGVVSALVAFTSTFAVVLAGLSAVGADPAQAAGGLMVVTVLLGLGSILLAVWSRQPITIAWSTPGAALLASTGPSRADGRPLSERSWWSACSWSPPA